MSLKRQSEGLTDDLASVTADGVQARKRVLTDRQRISPTIRVLCVDDHRLMLDGLKAHFSLDRSAAGIIEVVGALASAERLTEEVERLAPDIVLLDIEMPGPDAFEVAHNLTKRYSKVRVIFLSAHSREAYLAAAFKCGASGFFSKADDTRDISEGIRTVFASRQGAFVVGPKLRQLCVLPESGGRAKKSLATKPPADADSTLQASGQDTAPRTRIGLLSPRELEVLRLIGKGRSRTEIAQELCRSAKTVDGHQERILRKLGLSARADLIRFAIREGLASA